MGFHDDKGMATYEAYIIKYWADTPPDREYYDQCVISCASMMLLCEETQDGNSVSESW